MTEYAEAIKGGLQLVSDIGEASLRSVGANDIDASVAATIEADKKAPRFAGATYLHFQLPPFHTVFGIQTPLAEPADADGRPKIIVLILERITGLSMDFEIAKGFRLALVERPERDNGQRSHVDEGVQGHVH
jgi:hypothetical protein